MKKVYFLSLTVLFVLCCLSVRVEASEVLGADVSVTEDGISINTIIVKAEVNLAEINAFPTGVVLNEVHKLEILESDDNCVYYDQLMCIVCKPEDPFTINFNSYLVIKTYFVRHASSRSGCRGYSPTPKSSPAVSLFLTCVVDDPLALRKSIAPRL